MHMYITEIPSAIKITSLFVNETISTDPSLFRIRESSSARCLTTAIPIAQGPVPVDMQVF